MYARADGQVNSNSHNQNVTYDYNLYFGGKAPAVVGTHDHIADPLFVDAENGDLRVQPTSPAVDTGTKNLAPAEDILGAARPSGGGVDIGAYEQPSGAPAGSGDLYEAELGTIGRYSGAVSSARTGYTGSGFFDFHYSTTANLTLAIPRESAATYTLVVRYTNGAGVDRPLRVLVNGVEIAAALSFPATASWAEWKTVSLQAPLRAGANALRLEAGPNSGANIDSVRVTR